MPAKPIQTWYEGVQYRSRTEGRWAVFLRAIPLRAEYEAEGYTLPNGERYLPDFFLPDANLFVEVKGTVPTPEERRKAFWLYELTKIPVFIGCGQPAMRRGEIFDKTFDADLGPPSNVFFGGCRRCDQTALAYEWGETGHGYEPFGPCQNPKRCQDLPASQETDRISLAISKSQNERFGVYPRR
jgi:hypothetical protein